MAKGIADSIVRIPCKVDGNFFRYWLEFLSPFHNLTEREMEVAASFIKQRYLLSKVISDNDILEKVLMSEDTKSKIREECDISVAHFQVIMGKLRKNRIILENRINPKYIPNFSSDSNFKLMLLFDFS